MVTERPSMSAPWSCVSRGIETGAWNGYAGGGDRPEIGIAVCILRSQGPVMGFTIGQSALNMVNADSVGAQ